MRARLAAAATTLVLFAGCGGSGGSVPDKLSAYGFFTDAPAQVPAPGVIPYEVIASLFQDHATKHRFIVVPEGETIEYTDSGEWDFPLGTTIIKTFGELADLRDPSSAERLVETRLLVMGEDGWEPRVYLWDDAQTEATRVIAGARVPINATDVDGSALSFMYHVPNQSQCRGCHEDSYGQIALLGPKTRQMDRTHDYGSGPTNQIDYLASMGLFAATPPPAGDRVHMSDPYGTGDVELRARSYLDANCAHCHRATGSAGGTGLWLDFDVENEVSLGFCRRPVAAGEGTGGRSFDVVPGEPDSSILVFRMESMEPGIKMPELPAVLSDRDGVALVRQWIEGLAPGLCSTGGM